jgi:hypothetical protein
MDDGNADIRTWLWGLCFGIAYVLVFTRPKA